MLLSHLPQKVLKIAVIPLKKTSLFTQFHMS